MSRKRIPPVLRSPRLQSRRSEQVKDQLQLSSVCFFVTVLCLPDSLIGTCNLAAWEILVLLLGYEPFAELNYLLLDLLILSA